MILAEICTYLGTLSGVGTPGTNIFYGPMKEVYPDAVVLVSEYAGLPDEPALGDSSSSGKLIRFENPRIQIRVRGAKNDYDGPRTKAGTIHVGLAAICNQSLSGTYYLDVEPLSPPRHLRTDANFREEIGFTCQVGKALS